MSWVPFAVYLAAWVVLASASFALLWEEAATASVLWSSDYGLVASAALALAVAGPILSLGAWLVARASRPEEARKGLLADALLKGGVAALVGTVSWLIALFALDLCCRGV